MSEPTAVASSAALSKREENTLLARLAEHAERYDEMANYMRQAVLETDDLTMEERNLLSVAYKNVIGTRRASWRLVVTLLTELAERVDGDDAESVKHHIEIVEPFKQKIEKELRDISNTVLDLLVKHLIPHAKEVEVKVFYHKMAGDYYRYISEFSEREEKKESASAAYDSYREASDIARESLSPTHPLRLGLALNFSVFYYEVLNSASRACALAKQAFDEAIPELDTLPDELYHDSKLIMKLLRDNLTFWQNEADLSTENVEPAGSAAAVDNGKPEDREVSPATNAE